MDRKGRLTEGIETKQSRLRQFDELQTQILRALGSDAPDTARKLIADSEFRDAVRLAYGREEAVQSFAEFLIAGNNAWADSDIGSGILSICFWRD